ncbi:glycosyltransferase family 2 protein [Microbacterium proteolyticum]|uniref:glycosyltransferase family 2 protein n=1 Tax=Microbacterium proteolyticum TaxID=1572644 RepID=UPI001FAD12F4|nr:glycosyltransferase family 2 protein [Microbacterium proteolyticum]MCI9858721.1 glycosyltransferase family 2 protein [Microbacterium proteolyticum]
MTTTTRRARRQASPLPRRASWEAPPENLPTRRSQSPRRRTSSTISDLERAAVPTSRRSITASATRAQRAEVSVFSTAPTREHPAGASVFATTLTNERHTEVPVFAAPALGTPLPIDAEAPAASPTRRRRAGARTGSLVAALPAHNEEAGIAAAIHGLQNQTSPPDHIVVIADNCTDRTVEIARAHGAEVFVTTGNTHKKAGALNQFLAETLPHLREDDVVLVQDADSALDPDFLEIARKNLRGRIGAVGGVFRGSEGGGFVGHLQRNEYARYARDVRRLRGKCLVVTGTAAVLQVGLLRRIGEARLGGELPAGDGRGGVYDTSVLTEDNELTFAIRHLGYDVLSPAGCTLVTEVMPTWRELWNQRLRWKRGAVENCVQYGLTRVTAPYWGRQLLTMIGCVITYIYLATIVYAIGWGNFAVQPFWLGVTVIFIVERIVTVRDRGWRHMVLAGLMYELIIDLFLQIVHTKAYLDALTRRRRDW